MSDRSKDVGELAFEHIDSEPSRDLWRVRYTRTLSCDHEPTVLTSWYSSEMAANAEIAYQESRGAVNITVLHYTHDAESKRGEHE